MQAGEFKLVEVEKYIWELSKEKGMTVPARIYGNDNIIKHLIDDVKIGKEWNALKQVKNVAFLPGLQKYSLAMPDVHPGYGFAIGGVGAFDWNEGIVSFAGVGYDANCGVRDMVTPLFKKDIVKQIEQNLITVTQVSREYKVTRSSVYKWIYKYSKFLKK